MNFNIRWAVLALVALALMFGASASAEGGVDNTAVHTVELQEIVAWAPEPDEIIAELTDKQVGQVLTMRDAGADSDQILSSLAQTADEEPSANLAVTRKFGGAFRDLNVVGDYIVMIEGRNRVVIYSTEIDDATYHHMNRRLAATPRGDAVWDVAAEAPHGRWMHVYILTEGKLSLWLYNDGDFHLIDDTEIDGSRIAIGDYIYVTNDKTIHRLRKEDFGLVDSMTFDEAVMLPMIHDGKIYVPARFSVHVLDETTFEKTDEWLFRKGVRDIFVDDKWLMVEVFRDGTVSGSEFRVYNMDTRELQLMAWTGDHGLRWHTEPDVNATVSNGHLIVAGGWNALNAWDIESGDRLMGVGHRPIGGIFPSEVVRDGERVYVLDHFFGIRHTSWHADEFDEGYYDSVPIIPALSSAVKSIQVGNYFVVAGTGGLFVFDPVSDIITDYTTSVGDLFGESAIHEHYTLVANGTELLVGDDSALQAYSVTSYGELVRGDYVSWFEGSIFAPLNTNQFITTLTTTSPPLVTVTDRSNGNRLFVTSPGGSREHGVAIASSTDGSWVYVTTRDQSERSSTMYAYRVTGTELELAWHKGTNTTSTHGLAVSEQTVWSTGQSVSVCTNSGTGCIENGWWWESDTYLSTISARGDIALAAESVYGRMAKFQLEDGELVAGPLLYSGGPVMSSAFLNSNTALLAQRDFGIAVVALETEQIYLPFASR